MEIPSSFQEQIFFNFNNHKNCQRKNNENFNKLNQIINKLCEYNIYLLYHQKVEIRLLALNIIYESLFILKKDEKLLLPLIAKIWKNLHVLLEETNKTILLKVSSILFQICNFSDVFFKKRLELNAWSSLKKIVLLCKSELLNEIIVTETRLKFSCRILVDIFRSFTLLSKIDNIILPFLLECGSIIVSFLSPSYPSILKQEEKNHF